MTAPRLPRAVAALRLAKRVVPALTLAVTLHLASADVRAQQPWATIEGTVRDAGGDPLPGADLALVSEAEFRVPDLKTGANGGFSFRGLWPGVFRLTVSYPGFSPVTREHIVIVSGQSLRVDFALTVAPVKAHIEVTATPPLLDQNSRAAVTVVSSDMIERLPKGRDFTSLVAAATPGTNAEQKSGGLQVDGASGAENRFFVNGIDTTHLVTGVSDKEAIVDFLQEVQIETSGFSAQNRVSTGGAISAVTKSGTNAWRGMFGTYYDGSDFLAGHPRRKLRLNPADGITPEYITPNQDHARTWEPLAELGGPLVADRLWIYAAYALRERSQSRTVHFIENDRSGTFDSLTREHNLYSSVTSRLWSTANVRFSSVNEHNRGGVVLPSTDSEGETFDNPALFPSEIHTDGGSQLFSGSFQWAPNGRLAISATGGVFTSGAGTKNAYTGIQHRFFSPNFQFAEIPESLQHGEGYADAPRPWATQQDDFSRSVLGASATATFQGHGQHAVTAGVQLERLGNAYNEGEQAPLIQLWWDESAGEFGEPTRGTYGFYEVTQTQFSGNVRDTSWGVYVQDQWRPTSRVTIDLGLRADRETVPSYRPENPGLEFGFQDKLAPRLGFAWDPTGSGRWKAYGGWGAFFDMTKLELPRNYFGAAHSLDSFLTLDTYDWTQIACTSPPVPGPTCPGTLMGTIDYWPPPNAPDADGQPSVVDPALRPMRTHEFNVGLDRQIASTWVASLRYVRKRLDRAVEDVALVTDPELPFEYRIANPGFGVATMPFGPDRPRMPRAQRDYDALEVTAFKRLSDHWALNASYTYSRLRGNYSGLANSDDDRNTPNVEASFDSLYSFFDASGRAAVGPLATDRPHVAKLQGAYDLPWGTTLGANLFVGSGTPVQRYLFGPLYYDVVFYNGRLSDGRTPSLAVLDLLLQHSFHLPRHQVVQIELTALNLLDRAAATGFDMSRFRRAFGFRVPADAFSGWDPEAVAADNGLLHRPTFGMANAFQQPRQTRVALRFRF